MPPEVTIISHSAAARRRRNGLSADRHSGAAVEPSPSTGRSWLDFRWIDPDHADAVAEHRLDDLSAVMARQHGEPVALGHRGRETLRLDLVVAGEAQTWYLKRERDIRWKDLLGHVLAGRGFWTKARLELEVLRRLAAAGIRCPRPLACLQSGICRPQGALLLQSLGESHSLSDFLSAGNLDDARGSREEFFTALGREVARLHATGINQPDLYASHVHVLDGGAPFRFAFLDFQRSTWRRAVPLADRVRDLGALMATLPPRLASPRDRELFFDAYLAESQLEERAGEVIAGVARRTQKLLTRRKIWEIREADAASVRFLGQLESVETGTMWIDHVFRPALERAGLANFKAMMATTGGRLLRALPDRENWRIELQDEHGMRRGAYLKKHHTASLASKVRARLGMGPGETPGRIEARNVARLERGGLAAMRLIAFGEKLHSDGRLESFVLTEELVGHTQLDHYLRQRFAERRTGEPSQRDHDLLRLIQRVAQVACRFHHLGYNHRDLYCCHFFIKEPRAGEYQVNLIDLQRVEHRHRLRRRWIVKDLAQLAYSAPRDRIGCTHKMAFIKHYLGVRKLRPADKRLIREVLAKQQLMERHLGIHP